MNELENIHNLVERFLDGLTSIDEERQIATFIKAHRKDLTSLPDELQVVAEMFDEIQAMNPTSKRSPVIWRWALAAVTAAAAVCGVICNYGIRQSMPAQPVEPVLFVKASRIAGTLAMDTSVLQTPVRQAVTPVSVHKKSIPCKKRSEVRQDSMPTIPASSEMPIRGTMEITGFVPVAHSNEELRSLMLECELNLLEEKYQAYVTQRRTIKI